MFSFPAPTFQHYHLPATPTALGQAPLLVRAVVQGIHSSLGCLVSSSVIGCFNIWLLDSLLVKSKLDFITVFRGLLQIKFSFVQPVGYLKATHVIPLYWGKNVLQAPNWLLPGKVLEEELRSCWMGLVGKGTVWGTRTLSPSPTTVMWSRQCPLHRCSN